MSDVCHTLPCRTLGRTGLDISVLGLGGFHQVEATQDVIDAVVDRYLAAGGNYVETAKGYGAGASERKLGRALEGRRDGVVLATKTVARDREGAWRDLNESLERLRTSRIDLLFFHNVGAPEHLDAIRADDGALAAFLRAREEGLVRHFAVTSHWPAMYLDCLVHLPVDAVMVWGNYLDFLNYPEIPRDILPAARDRGAGVLFMKPLADGYLYRSPRAALRYALAQEVDCLVAGFNSVEQLEADLAACCETPPADEDETAAILRDAVELGDYVCRQCDDCPVCDDADTLRRVFELEGKFDRQMDDRRPTDAAHYALRERLKRWFGNHDRAMDAYAELGEPAPRLADGALRPCPFGLDVARKLRLVHAKLSRAVRVEEL